MGVNAKTRASAAQPDIPAKAGTQSKWNEDLKSSFTNIPTSTSPLASYRVPPLGGQAYTHTPVANGRLCQFRATEITT